MTKKRILLGCLSLIGLFIIIIVIGVIVENSKDKGDEEAPIASVPPAVTEPAEPEPAATEPAATEPPRTQFEMTEAIDQGLIEVHALGTRYLRNIVVVLESLSDYDLEIAVLPGTVFESENPGVQRMVLTTGDNISLRKNKTRSRQLDAVSIDMWLDKPAEDERLVLSPAPAPGELVSLLELDEFREEPYYICQIAAWTITDNPRPYEYEEADGFSSTPGTADIERLRDLFTRAGIPYEVYQTLTIPIYVELIDASNRGLVLVNAFGKNNISSIKVNLTSSADDLLEIDIQPGTMFGAQTAGVQSMVVITERTFLLYPGDSTGDVSIDAACANMELDQPGRNEGLLLSTQPLPEDLIKLLALDEFVGETMRVQQFAIWTITDNPERDGYVRIGGTYDILGSGPNDEEIAEIRLLFEMAGILTDSYRALN